MHPARSLVLFTSLSGAGFGALAWLGLIRPDGMAATVAAAVGVLLCVAGLVASTFHLRHPERGWRALSQWRTSWLSREGVLALATLAVAAVWIAGPVAGLRGWPVDLAALLTAAGSLATVAATAMIYRSLWTVPAWSAPSTVPGFLALALASGGLVATAALALAGTPPADLPVLAAGTAAALIAAAGVKAAAWRALGRPGLTDTASAVGLAGRTRTVRLLEAPSTSETWLTREMVFEVARRRSAALRRIAALLGLGMALPALAVAWTQGGGFAAFLAVVAALAGLAAVLVERWLFFAEARHKVALYYGADRV